MKQAQKVIIDGYNVIYTDDRLRRLAIKDLEGARKEFIRLLKQYLCGKQIQVTLVFDGRRGMVETESIIPGKLQVVFSDYGQTADELIVSTLEQSTNPRATIVVTSDMADIGGAARKLGCQVIGSKRFLGRLVRDTSTPQPEQESADVNRGGIDYWLDKFTRDDQDD